MSIPLQRLGKQLFFKSPALTKPLVAGYATTAIPSLTSSGRILPTIEPSQSNKQLYAFTSLEGKRLFREAMDQGHAESFFKLMGNFSGQSSSMLGSVSSLAMVLNALEIDPKRRWKGSWRWYSDEILETCSTREQVLTRGMSFDEFACTAQSHCHVQPYRASSSPPGYSRFIRHLSLVTSKGSPSIMVVNYSRSRLGQKAQKFSGHFSPVGGYNKASNRVLIMDVARGQYPSVWVDARALYEAMQEGDIYEAGKSRGYFLLEAPGSFINQPSITCNACSQRHCQKQRVQANA